MKFIIHTAAQMYSDKKRIRILESVGFKFETYNNKVFHTKKTENAHIEIPVIKDINSMEELTDFIKLVGDIIIRDNIITIYDDFVE